MRTVNINGESIDKDRIRPLILDACIEVLTMHGREELTMSRIAKQTGIAKGTLYNYFENKEDLLKSVCDTFAQPLFEDLYSGLDPQRPARDIFIEIIQMMVTVYRQYWRVIEAFLSEFGKNNLVEEYSEDSFKAQIIKLLTQLCDLAEAQGTKLPYSSTIMAEIIDGASNGLIRCTSTDEKPGVFPTEIDIEKFANIFFSESDIN